MKSQNNRAPMNHSDSVSSTDSGDDLELVTQLTRTFLNDHEFADEIVQELSEFVNKENIIRLLNNLLETSRISKRNDSNNQQNFEINHTKSALSLTHLTRSSDDNLFSSSFETSFGAGQLPTNIIVTSVANAVFTSNEARTKFEQLFLGIDSECKFCHLRIFNRCTIQFSNPIAAILARIQLNEQMFMGESLKMFLSNVNDIL